MVCQITNTIDIVVFLDNFVWSVVSETNLVWSFSADMDKYFVANIEFSSKSYGTLIVFA